MVQQIGSILIGADEFVARYVASKIGIEARFTSGFTAIGVVRRGVFVGGVVYHNYIKLPYGNIIETSLAFDDPSWALPGTLRALSEYPFVTLDCVRVNAIVAKGNKRCRKWVEGFGFKREGVHPCGIDGRQTAITYGLLRNDCKWLKDKNGQVSAFTAAAA